MSQSNQHLLHSKRLHKKTSNDSNVTITKLEKYYLANQLSLAELEEYLLHDHQIQCSQQKPLEKVFYMIPKKQLIKENIQDQLTTNFIKCLTNQSSKFKASRANTFTSRRDLTRTTSKNFNSNKQGNVIQILAFKPNRFLNKENEIQSIIGIIAYSLLHYCLCNRIGFRSIESCYASMMNLRTDSIFHALKQKIYQLSFQESFNDDYNKQHLIVSAPGSGSKTTQQTKDKSKILTLENKKAIFAKFMRVCQKQSKDQRNLYDEIDFAVGIDEVILDIFKMLFTDPMLKIVTVESIENVLSQIGLDKVFIKQVGKDKAIIKIDDYQTRVIMHKENQFYFAILEQSQLIEEFKNQMRMGESIAELKGSKEPRKASVNTIQEDMEIKDVVCQNLYSIQQQKITSPLLNRKLGKGGFQVLKKQTLRSEGQISEESDRFSECTQVLLKKKQSKDFGLNMITNLNLENSPDSSKKTQNDNVSKLGIKDIEHHRHKSQNDSSPFSSQQLKNIELYLLSSKFSNPSMEETQKKDRSKMTKKSSFGLDPLIRQDLDNIENDQQNQNLTTLQIRLVQSVRQENSKLKQGGLDKSDERSFIQDQESVVKKQNEEFLGLKQIQTLTKSQQQKQSQLQDITNDKLQNISSTPQAKQQQQYLNNCLADSKKFKLSFVQEFSQHNYEEKQIGLTSSVQNRNSSSSVNENLNKQLENSIKLIRRQTDTTNCKGDQFIRNVPKLQVQCLSSDSEESSPKRKAKLQMNALISPKQKQKGKFTNFMSPFTLNSMHKIAIKQQWDAEAEQNNKSTQLVSSPQSTKKRKKLPYEFNKNLNSSKKFKNSKNLTQQIKKSKNSIQTSFTEQTNITKNGHIPSFLLKKIQQQVQNNPQQEVSEKSIQFMPQAQQKQQFFPKMAETQYRTNKPLTINLSNTNNNNFHQEHTSPPRFYYPPTQQLRVTSPNLGPQPYKELFNRNSVGNNPANRQMFQFRQRHQTNDINHQQQQPHFYMQNSYHQPPPPQQYTPRAHEQHKVYYNSFQTHTNGYRHI